MGLFDLEDFENILRVAKQLSARKSRYAVPTVIPQAVEYQNNPLNIHAEIFEK
jgi:hypothetical protein